MAKKHAKISEDDRRLASRRGMTFFHGGRAGEKAGIRTSVVTPSGSVGVVESRKNHLIL